MPRAAEATGIYEKLSGYSLNAAHKRGRTKARGFERILGVTIADIDYVEAAIRDAILETPVRSVRVRPPYGVHCVVALPLQGLGLRSDREAELLAVWEFADAGAVPRLVSAYLSP